MWGQGDDGRKIHWVKYIYKLKQKGGLVAKDIHKFNATFLGKWKWRVMEEQSG